MADTFQLEIVTPEKKVVETAAEEVQIPGKNGYLGVLPGHERSPHSKQAGEQPLGEIQFHLHIRGGNIAYVGMSKGMVPESISFRVDSFR